MPSGKDYLEKPGVAVDCQLGDGVGAVWPPGVAPGLVLDLLQELLHQTVQFLHGQFGVLEASLQFGRVGVRLIENVVVCHVRCHVDNPGVRSQGRNRGSDHGLQAVVVGLGRLLDLLQEERQVRAFIMD